MLTYFQIRNNKNTLYRIIDYILNDKALVNIFGYNQAVVKSGWPYADRTDCVIWSLGDLICDPTSVVWGLSTAWMYPGS